MAIVALSLLRHRELFAGTCHVYKEVWSPSIGEKFECSITGSWWLVMSKSDDISKRNTASLAIGATCKKYVTTVMITDVRYYFARCIMQYLGNCC